MSASTLSSNNPDWVGEDGWYQPHDYWLSLCGLYGLYAFSLDKLGDVRGKRLLDCGCGKGHTSVMLAKRGARVEAFDASGPDLAIAGRLAASNGVTVEHKEMVFEKLDYPDARFDLAFGACVLHHVDIPQAMRELSRVMKPGARAVFVENSARNPLLMFARRKMVGSMGIPRYGDDDEHPLRQGDFDAMTRNFDGKVTIHHPEFVFFRLIDFYILRRRAAPLSWLLRKLDALCQKIPVVREYGYFLIVQFDRAEK
ncbi:MAG: class I SAM-dependent methyltransferase [Gammaproteobacteria bacterium]|jgi:SAM-dependent methyltransferase|nr:class I SAM-dependent methyltransferase [Gammaproteobacteria bacterium]MBU0772759.1 class I SAM-dependent methyltransferase [Gammaproteobacteria bacterium]MBU0855687.1 class I SAM-dependent methyltransferase [Gammaproteobacteria bacterium]MBU1847044.1 class I SAM-dependent methyltransferase [Gammaproteobacteria bacterium]